VPMTKLRSQSKTHQLCAITNHIKQHCQQITAITALLRLLQKLSILLNQPFF